MLRFSLPILQDLDIDTEIGKSVVVKRRERLSRRVVFSLDSHSFIHLNAASPKELHEKRWLRLLIDLLDSCRGGCLGESGVCGVVSISWGYNGRPANNAIDFVDVNENLQITDLLYTVYFDEKNQLGRKILLGKSIVDEYVEDMRSVQIWGPR